MQRNIPSVAVNNNCHKRDEKYRGKNPLACTKHFRLFFRKVSFLKLLSNREWNIEYRKEQYL
jgi:hypothetical protein